jgi:putative peptide zinc metalloprotease protein
MAEGKTFSDSWYKVANLKVSLRTGLNIRKQYFQGEEWYVLHDPLSNKFFRFRPEVYEFLARLNTDSSVENIWEQCMERNPENSPGQDDVIKLLSTLYSSNLLYFTSCPDNAKLFERYSKRRKQELKGKLMSFLFIRIPLFDPDNFLEHLKPIAKLIFRPLGTLVWLIVTAIAIKILFDNWSNAFDQFQGILAPGKLVLLYAALVFIKIMHEFGHSLVCKHYGGEVHTIGLMFLIFTPLPYMDATSSWAFRERYQRILVAAAGIIVELFLAAIAVIIWGKTGQGTLNSLAYNVMLIASVFTILFNANPLLRFDGYYILSDMLDIPNLQSRSQTFIRHLAEKYLFGLKESISPANNRTESSIFGIYGISSVVYKTIILVGIIVFLSDKFFMLGLILTFMCLITWGLIPLYKFIKYITSEPRLARNRLRVWYVCGLILALIILIFCIPFPQKISANGVVESTNFQKILTQYEGYVDTIIADSGNQVSKGEPLVQMRSRELELDIISTRAQKQETLLLIHQAINDKIANTAPLKKRLNAFNEKLKYLKKQYQALTIRSEEDGQWYAPTINEYAGAWVQRGLYLGDVVNLSDFYFIAVVTQDESGQLFQNKITEVSVKLKGQAENKIAVESYTIIPFEQKKLPSAALGWQGGGDIAISTEDGSGVIAKEPFFLIKAKLAKQNNSKLLHLRSGMILLELPAIPLYSQIYRSIRQVLQKRYQI